LVAIFGILSSRAGVDNTQIYMIVPQPGAFTAIDQETLDGVNAFQPVLKVVQGEILPQGKKRKRIHEPCND
jgi:hypothetical protein